MPGRALIVALTLMLTASNVLAADIERYVGKLPFDRVAGRTLYQAPGLRQEFIAKFGAERWATLMTYQTAGPIEAVSDATLGRLIVTWQCKPHDCPNNAAVLLRPTAEIVAVCFAIDDGNGSEWSAESWSRRSSAECGTDGADIVARFKAAQAKR
jgi:hypothetical protein